MKIWKIFYMGRKKNLEGLLKAGQGKDVAYFNAVGAAEEPSGYKEGLLPAGIFVPNGKYFLKNINP